MKSWLPLLGGLAVWAIHFFGIYAMAEIGLHIAVGLALTILCAGAEIWILRYLSRQGNSDPFADWKRSVAIGGAAISLMAVCWQALPVIWH